MLTFKIRILIIVFAIIALAYIINMIRKKRLELRYALVWIASGIIILLLAVFPQIINWLSKLLGIYNPVNMLFFLGFCLALAILFSLTMFASRASIRIKQLTQEIAIKEDEINKMIQEISKEK